MIPFNQCMAVALLMSKTALQFKSPHVAVVPLIPVISTQISLCYKKGRRLSAAANNFLQRAMNHGGPTNDL